MADAIRSTANPQIKTLVRLRKRRERDRTSKFLIEGYRELSRAAEARIRLHTVYYAPGLFLGVNEPDLLSRISEAGVRLVEVGDTAFRRASYRDRPEGLLAIAYKFDTALSRVELPDIPLLLVVESIEKPGNLGTMLRTSDAAGADAVIVCDPTTDLFNPNVVRASLGTLFGVTVAVTTTEQCQAWLAAQGVTSHAATPTADAAYTEADLTGGAALVVGSEQLGLSAEWLSGADRQVRIPMAGAADSLNAAMAAGILLFEAVRQRAS